METTKRYLKQLVVWRGLVARLSDPSRRALRQALIEDFASRRLSEDDVDVIETVLQRHGESLKAVA